MRKRVECNDRLVTFDSLTPGKQQQWLQQQPPPTTREEAQEQKRVKRLIRLSKEEESK